MTTFSFWSNVDNHLRGVHQENQGGYKKGILSESLPLYLTESGEHFIDEGKFIGAIFINFRKTFDSVTHDILYYKMYACGLSGKLLCWLHSYLSHRHQFVEVKGVRSTSLELKRSVLQGSLLGPRLHSIYVAVYYGELYLYTDDTTAYWCNWG